MKRTWTVRQPGLGVEEAIEIGRDGAALVSRFPIALTAKAEQTSRVRTVRLGGHKRRCLNPLAARLIRGT